MKNNCIDDFLRMVPAFSEVSDQALNEIKTHLYKEHYPKGGIIFQQGDPVTALYIVEMGKIEIYKDDEEGKRLTMWFINPAEMFCVPTLIFGKAIASAEAVKDTLLYCLDKEHFDRILREFPEFSTGLLLCLSNRILSYSNSVDKIAFNSTVSRIAEILLTHKTADEEGNTVCLLSQTDITSLAGICRETVCRTLNKLKADHIISVKYRMIIIHDLQKLKALCKERGTYPLPCRERDG
ncbi:MAG: Crp/Fnr family transcriptional regulator [Nitrospirota bacterium]